MSVLLHLLADPAIMNLAALIVSSAVSAGVLRVTSVLRARGIADVDEKTNTALISAIERAAWALMARGIPEASIPGMVAGVVKKNRPDAISRFGLDKSGGDERLRELVTDAMTRIKAAASAPSAVPPAA